MYLKDRKFCNELSILNFVKDRLGFFHLPKFDKRHNTAYPVLFIIGVDFQSACKQWAGTLDTFLLLNESKILILTITSFNRKGAFL